MNLPKPKFPIGTKFKQRIKKRTDICTVVDYVVSYNMAGEIVNRRYIASHDFMGQSVVDHDVPEASIARNIIN